MNFRIVRAMLLLTLSIVSAIVVITDSPLTSIIPKANAAVPGSSALLGFWSETKKSSAVIDSALGANTFVKFDINVTGAGAIKGFIVQFNWTSTSLSYTNSSYGNYVNAGLRYHLNTMCPAAQGCLFDGFPASGITEFLNSTSPGGYYLSLADGCTATCPPTVPGTGILFRIVFKVLAASKSTVIHFKTDITQIQNPGAVPYQSIDGYFDNNSPALLNYPISISPITITVTRPVSSTGTSISPGATVTLGTFTGSSPSVTLGVQGLPQHASPSFTTNTCTAACTSTLTITVHGGPAGGPNTTPSGTYTLAVFANATAPASVIGMVKETWLKLVVNPPAPPVFTLTSASSTSYTQESGASNVFSMTATLTSGSNDTLSVSSSGCLDASLECVLTPSSGVFAIGPNTFASSLNVSISPTGALGAYHFNVTATTSGTYSEVSKSLDLVFTITVIRTHDLTVSGETLPKLYSYEGVSLVRPSGHPINATIIVTNQGRTTETFSVNATAKQKLQLESPNNITFVDANNNGLFDSGVLRTDSRIRYVDSNSNNVWNPATLTTDPKVKFADANSNGHWDPGEGVAYDADSSGTFNLGDTLISGAITGGASLIGDAKLKFIDANGNTLWNFPEPVVYDSNSNSAWDPGFENVIAGKPFNQLSTSPEAVIYDANGNGIFNTGDSVLLGNSSLITLGTALKSDPKLKFEDQNGNGVREISESIVYDTNGNGNYELGEVDIVGPAPLRETVIRDTNNNGLYDSGEPVIAGVTPALSTPLIKDNNIRFVDSNFNGKWDSGESVVYDSNGDSIYESSDNAIAGAPPSLGILVGTATVTSLLPAEPIVAGSVANNTALTTDAKIRFLDINGNGVYDGGDESVVYDSNADGKYNASDPRIKFVDTNFSGAWDSGEPVVYDANNNGKYDGGEQLLVGTRPTVGKGLNTDLKIRYVDANNNGVWNSLEKVAYDSNNNGIYNTGEPAINQTAPTNLTAMKGEPVIAGPTPSKGVSLADGKLRFADANSDTTWDNNEAIVYDLNSDGHYMNGARTIIINVNPESAPHGNYAIYAYTIPVTGELNLGNNGLTTVNFTQKLRADITGDCKVNIFDLTSVGGIFGQTATSPGFNKEADLNNDGFINIFDLSAVGGNFGGTC